MNKAIFFTLALIFLSAVTACSQNQPKQSNEQTHTKPSYTKAKQSTQPATNKTKYTKVADINLKQYEKFFEENYFPASNRIPSGYIISTTKGLDLITPRDRVYATSSEPDPIRFSKGDYLITTTEKAVYSDNDDKHFTGTLLNPVGKAKFLKYKGELAVLEVTEAYQEIFAGSKLIPMNDIVTATPDYAYTTSEHLTGKVIYILNDQRLANEYSSIMINQGTKHGIKNGMVIYIYTTPTVQSPSLKPSAEITIPGSKIAKAVIYRTSPWLSIALVIDASEEIYTDYIVTTYERN